MKNKLKYLSIIAFAAVAAAGLSSGPDAEAATALPPAESATRALYRQHCATCHGNDGKSNTKRGRETEANDLTTADVKGSSVEKIGRVISNGKGEMPGFKQKLTPAQIASVARYVKAL